MNSSPIDARPSPIAGRWYPGDAGTLQSELRRCLREAQRHADESEPSWDIRGARLVGLVAPHAGLRYSGPVAAHAFRHLKPQSFNTAIVLGPYHYAHPAPLLTTAHDAFETPLGQTGIARDDLEALGNAIRDSLGFDLTPIRQDPEHSLEMELLFLQETLGEGFRLLPIMLVDQSAGVAAALGDCIGSLLRQRRERCLLVASTDLSHFYAEPQANAFDHKMLRLFEAFDPDGILKADQSGSAYACGRGAVAAVFHAAKTWGANRVRIERYATSADVTGDRNSVVGYAAARIVQEETPTDAD